MSRPLSRLLPGCLSLAILAATPTLAQSAAPRADLATAALRGIPATVEPGSSAALVTKVTNAGRRTAGASSALVALSRDARRSADDRRLATVKIGRLRARRARAVAANLTIPSSVRPGRYRVLLCADATRKVREARESNNCKASAVIEVVAKPPAPTPQPVPPAPPQPVAGPAVALHLEDGRDFGTRTDPSDGSVGKDTVIDAEIRIGNGRPGAVGYTVTTLDPQPQVAGKETVLAELTNEDDESAQVNLPFSFPLGGVPYRTAFVSINGWVGFGAPAGNYFHDWQHKFLGGPALAVGEFQRGVMPYFSDLDTEADEGLQPDLGSVTMVDPGDGTIAVRWHAEQHADDRIVRDFQAVLFPDGRVRYDYLSPSQPSTLEKGAAFVGLSPGTGGASLVNVAMETVDTPARSVLITPTPVEAGPASPGAVEVEVPRSTRFSSADEDCSLVKQPELLAPGKVRCEVPALEAGGSVVRRVRFRPSELRPTGRVENLRLKATYVSGAVTAADAELTPASSKTFQALTPATSPVVIVNPGTAPRGETMGIVARVDQSVDSGLVNPIVEVTVPVGMTLIDSGLVRCTPLPVAAAGGTFSCALPDGARDPEWTLRVSAAAAGSYKVGVTTRAENLSAPVTAARTVTFT